MIAIVRPMTSGQDSDADDRDARSSMHDGRFWQHPSEVGLATRGKTDRRRSALIASGVVLGGLGLLMAGVLLGSFDDSEPAPVAVAGDPMVRAVRSIATVTAVDADGSSSTLTGVVVDDRGHLLVDSRAIAGADEIWAQCPTGELEQVDVVGTDPVTELSVLRRPTPAGAPVSMSTSMPGAGHDLEVVEVDADGIRTMASVAVADGRPGPAAQLLAIGGGSGAVHFSAQVDGAVDDVRGAMVFDHSGRLAGIAMADDGAERAPDVDHARSGPGAITTMGVLSAADANAVAERLIAARP